MAETGIDYAKLTQDALRGIVRSVLTQVAVHQALPGNHHFFISFLTQADGVAVSKRLREQYPEEMTIVLQHQFWDLQVHDDRFEVKLKFTGVPEKLVVPYTAIRVFVDPSAQFAIPFETGGTRPDMDRGKPAAGANLPRIGKNAEGSGKRTPNLSAVPSVVQDASTEPPVESAEPTVTGPATELPAGNEDKPARPALRAVEQPAKAPGSADVVDFNTFRKK